MSNGKVDCDTCDRICGEHAEAMSLNRRQEERLQRVEEICDTLPKMQGRVHLLMYLLITTMTVLITISSFSFLQLMEFKNIYFQDRKEHAEMHSRTSLETEKRYMELINKLGERVTKIESRRE